MAQNAGDILGFEERVDQVTAASTNTANDCIGDLQRILGTFDMRQDVAHEVGKVRLKCVIAFVILRLQQGVQDFDERPVGYALTIGRAASLEYAGVEQVVSR